MSSFLTEAGMMEINLKNLAEQRECITRGHQRLNVEHLLNGLINYFSELHEDKIREDADYINWDCVSSYSSLEIITNLAKDFPDDIKWISVSRRNDLTKEFKNEFSHKILKPTQYGYL